MKKRVLVITGFILFCTVCALSLPQGPRSALAESTELKLGYVDMQKALSSSRAGKAAQKDYETEVKKAQSDLDKKKSEFERMRSEFDKQRDSLSDSARAERAEKLRTMEKELKRNFKDTQEELQRKNMKLVGSMVKKLREVVEEVGQQEGFVVILEKSSQAVLYADNKIDITEKVIEEFDAAN